MNANDENVFHMMVATPTTWEFDFSRLHITRHLSLAGSNESTPSQVAVGKPVDLWFPFQAYDSVDDPLYPIHLKLFVAEVLRINGVCQYVDRIEKINSFSTDFGLCEDWLIKIVPNPS